MRNLLTAAVFLALFTIEPIAASETVTFTYDALGRLQITTTAGTVNSGLQTSIVYDAAGSRANYTVTGATPAVLIPITYSSSSTYSNYTGLAGAGNGMRDGIYVGAASVHATLASGSSWVMMDLGSVKALGKATIAPISFAFQSWGPVYTDFSTLQRSDDGVNWTTVTPISGTVDGNATEYPVNSSARYLRVITTTGTWLGLGDFYVRTP
jgi:RHS Repeat